jgi:hypothetical protein
MFKELLLVVAALPALAQNAPVHVWEKQEITLQAQNNYRNPYMEVDVWVDLTGPGFRKRVYGFWDGGNTFRVRVVAVTPGEWRWVSGSNPPDPGLNSRSGGFKAVAWTEAEMAQNACRRGFVRATKNGHALEYADGTPYFMLGDTWWATPTFRFPWADRDIPHEMGPQATFQDYVRYRKAQGLNAIAVLAAFPHWANDGKPAHMMMDDGGKIPVRSAWPQPGTNNSAKDMHNEGGRPFLFPGKVPGHEDLVPDFERINPAYYQYFDRKVDYLNSQGFIPFIEIARRDISTVWKKYYQWPDTYARYISYVFARYHANNTILSPIHFDTPSASIRGRDYNAAINMAWKKHGPPPFGNLVSTNSLPSTLINFGNDEDARWLTMHQTGNAREHEYYWHHTEIFHTRPALPSIAGEPYYAGWAYRGTETPRTTAPGGERDDRFCRSAMYGNFLSGGFGGHIYAAEGIWQAAVEPQSPIKMWEAFQWKSAAQLRHLKTFALSEGARYQELIPATDYLAPNSNHTALGYEGWAFCARTSAKDLYLLYLEKDISEVTLRSALPDQSYSLQWFDPRSGEWSSRTAIKSDVSGRIRIPKAPSDDDWALQLVLSKQSAGSSPPAGGSAR